MVTLETNVTSLPINKTVSGYGSVTEINHKDFIKKRLRRLEIAYETMSGHPHVLNEFIKKVKSDRKSDSTTEEDELTRLNGKYISTT